MKKPDIPNNESNRLAALSELEILDTPAEARFDRITRIARQHFNTAIALVSLVDEKRQWFKSRQGLDAGETPRDISFCGHAILDAEIFHIPNALEDERFFDNPLVTGAPNIRFYAGAPLHSPEAERIGTLCIIDDKPRVFSEQDLLVLRDLADCVEAELARSHLLRIAEENRRHEQRLNHLLQASPGVIYSCKAFGDFGATYVSDKVKEMLGYNAKQFTEDSKFWINHVHPVDREPILAKLGVLFEKGNHSHEYRFRHADGHYCWMLDKLHLIRDEEGHPFEIVGLWMDISERKLSEQQSQAGESRIRAIVDNVIDGIISIDEKGIIKTVNPAAERLFGYQREEMLDNNVKMLMPEPYRNTHDVYIQNYVTTGDRKVIGIGREVTGLCKDGTTFPMELAVGEMEVNGERMFSGIVRDISERKQSESQIKAAESRIRAIVDNVIDGIISIDEKGIIKTANPATERLFGYQVEEMLGQNVRMLMPENYSRSHDVYLQNYLATGVRKIIGIGREVVGRRKDGSTFPMELAVSEMEVNSERMFSGIVRDITERKKIERMKSEFISTVSHELRTPLTSIRGALSLVLGKAADQLSDKPRRMLEMAERNSERLTLLINDILDLEKIESGRLAFEFESVDLARLAHRACQDNEGYARSHQVTLRVMNQPAQALVWGDEHRLLQVFANLISNAVKFSPVGADVEVSVDKHDEGFRVTVRDYGPGISDKFRARIFQRFAQADSSDSREKGGTGLGLSITKAIIEHHGGQVGYDTELGEGTTFHFDIPFWQEMQEAEIDTSSGARVLICEDNVDVARVLAELLQQEAVVADIASTAAGAKVLLSKHDYHLLLLDLTLPDADGLQLLQELREENRTSTLPVIIISGRADEGRAVFTGDAVNVVDWIQKPFDKKRLERAMHEVFHEHTRPRILHVEDDPDIIQVVEVLLEEIADFIPASSLHEARSRLTSEVYDLVLLDLGLADGSGVDLLDEIKSHCPVVIFSGEVPDEKITQQVSSALTKSKTSNEKLLTTIKKLLRNKKGVCR